MVAIDRIACGPSSRPQKIAESHGSEPTLEVRAGNVPDEILSVADQVATQAIIMGRCGTQGGRIGKLLAGPLIDDVASAAACPVIGVRSATWTASWH